MKVKKAVLVGCGGISNAWFDACAEFADLEFVGLVDLNLENAEKRKAERGLTNAVVGADLEEVLEKSDPDILFDCTVPAAHKNVTTTALERGCHVLGEKPIAESMDDARAMLAAAERSGKTYAVIQNRRYDKNIIRFRDVLRSEKTGKLTTLHSDFIIGAHFGGFRDEMKHVLLLDMAIHTFDQARFISGKDPVSVMAHEWNPPGSWYAHGASAVCVFEMDNGVVFTYRGSWCAEGLNTTWECDWRAICENGSYRWDGADFLIGETPEANSEGLIRAQRRLEIPPAAELGHVGHAGVIREFLDCLDSGRKPQTDCSDNIKSLAMVHAAVESAEQGRKIALK